MKYKGIIFDLDGTLIDTVADLHDAVNFMLEKNNLKQVTLDQTKHNIGNGMFNLVKRSVPDEYKSNQTFLDQGVSDLIANYKTRLTNHSKPYPGIVELLNFCMDNGIKIAVASNKSNNETQEIMRTLLPDIEFTKIIGNIEGIPHKPDPTVINMILEAMELAPQDVLYIGDKVTDYDTATNSNLDCLLVSYGYEDQDKINNLPGTVYLDTPEEIINYLSQ